MCNVIVNDYLLSGHFRVGRYGSRTDRSMGFDTNRRHSLPEHGHRRVPKDRSLQPFHSNCVRRQHQRQPLSSDPAQSGGIESMRQTTTRSRNWSVSHTPCTADCGQMKIQSLPGSGGNLSEKYGKLDGNPLFKITYQFSRHSEHRKS